MTNVSRKMVSIVIALLWHSPTLVAQPIDGVVRSLDFPRQLEWRDSIETISDWYEPCPESEPFAYVRYLSTNLDPFDFVSIRLGSIEVPEGIDWRIVIRDEGDKCVSSASSEEILPGGVADMSHYWTADLTGRSFRIDVYAASRPDGLNFVVDQVLISTIKESNKVYMDEDNPRIVPIEVYRGDTNVWSASRAVGRLQIMVNGKRRPCTGFLISEYHFLTNRHCFCSYTDCTGANNKTRKNINELCRETEVVFGYTRERFEPMKKYRCHEVLQSSYPLDFALIELWGRPGSVWGMLEIDNKIDLVSGETEQLMVIQHSNDPDGMKGLKGIALFDCFVMNVDQPGRRKEHDTQVPFDVAQDFHHSCDTSGGSSGSPVMTRNGVVVGLHRGGIKGSIDDNSRYNRAVYIKLVEEQIAL